MFAVTARRFQRPWAMHALAILALCAQVVSVFIAPTAESYASRSAPAHVEPDGTHLHHSHNPNDCPACIALQLSASSITAAPAANAPAHANHAVPRGTVDVRVLVTRLRAPGAPRAPPPPTSSAPSI